MMVEGKICPQGTLGNIWRHYYLLQLGEEGGKSAMSILWVEARDVAKHPTVHTGQPPQQLSNRKWQWYQG